MSFPLHLVLATLWDIRASAALPRQVKVSVHEARGTSKLSSSHWAPLHLLQVQINVRHKLFPHMKKQQQQQQVEREIFKYFMSLKRGAASQAATRC